MLDFTELSEDGTDLELLIREILATRGFDVRWSGAGPDGGRDLVCVERRDSFFKPDDKSWLIQCKHNARADRAVGTADVGDIVDTCTHHQCRGFLLACSTHPSSALINKLEGITSNSANSIEATYWDAVKIEQILNTPRCWPVAQRFFPTSAAFEDWRIWATERPNNWVVNYRGYYFYLNNRIGSDHEHHLDSVRRRIEDLESIPFPDGHRLRLRCAYYDDKHGSYTWYIDYMYPHKEAPVRSANSIAASLGNDHFLDDGQMHTFDVINRSYSPVSDHHDFDHYDYYSHGGSFPYGLKRPRTRTYVADVHDAAKESLSFRNDAFQRLESKLSELQFINVVRACNAQIEYLDRFYKQFHWSSIVEEVELETDRFFSAWILLEVNDEAKFHSLMSYVPQSFPQNFRLTRPYIYVPDPHLSDRSRRNDDGKDFYELTLAVDPIFVANKTTGRNLLNTYFANIISAIDTFLQDTQCQMK